MTYASALTAIYLISDEKSLSSLLSQFLNLRLLALENILTSSSSSSSPSRSSLSSSFSEKDLSQSIEKIVVYVQHTLFLVSELFVERRFRTYQKIAGRHYDVARILDIFDTSFSSTSSSSLPLIASLVQVLAEEEHRDMSDICEGDEERRGKGEEGEEEREEERKKEHSSSLSPSSLSISQEAIHSLCNNWIESVSKLFEIHLPSALNGVVTARHMVSLHAMVLDLLSKPFELMGVDFDSLTEKKERKEEEEFSEMVEWDRMCGSLFGRREKEKEESEEEGKKERGRDLWGELFEPHLQKRIEGLVEERFKNVHSSKEIQKALHLLSFRSSQIRDVGKYIWGQDDSLSSFSSSSPSPSSSSSSPLSPSLSLSSSSLKLLKMKGIGVTPPLLSLLEHIEKQLREISSDLDALKKYFLSPPLSSYLAFYGGGGGGEGREKKGEGKREGGGGGGERGRKKRIEKKTRWERDAERAFESVRRSSFCFVDRLVSFCKKKIQIVWKESFGKRGEKREGEREGERDEEDEKREEREERGVEFGLFLSKIPVCLLSYSDCLPLFLSFGKREENREGERGEREVKMMLGYQQMMKSTYRVSHLFSEKEREEREEKGDKEEIGERIRERIRERNGEEKEKEEEEGEEGEWKMCLKKRVTTHELVEGLVSSSVSLSFLSLVFWAEWMVLRALKGEREREKGEESGKREGEREKKKREGEREGEGLEKRLERERWDDKDRAIYWPRAKVFLLFFFFLFSFFFSFLFFLFFFFAYLFLSFLFLSLLSLD